ncbi:hypothetical protein AM499_04985 [Bacillus sp. FJAT-22090]|uniref:hypothetical protein n=1 Tax=Bacillus sp. FJAT-22090 TaxID=1581038 RepID=UPI0006AFE4F8|nr:hypothetical protein [Bacillus sp. FJAT-22090]ALC85242.1 hypothetical protein AM499_04985 [Bacillus sp. FJAT-22090]
MYLREIDLDLPHQKNYEYINKMMSSQNLTEEEAVRLDYWQNWKDLRILFRDQVRCIAGLYVDLLGKFKTVETKKIMINCLKDLDMLNSGPINSVGFTDVYVFLDLENYWKLTNIEKKKVILEKINEGILQVAKEFSWDISTFNQVTKEIIDRDYVNEFSLKQKSSPDRKHKAEIFCQHEIDFINISMIIRERKSNEIIKNELLFKDRPHELSFVQKLGELKWISNSEITLTHKYKLRKKWTVKMDEKI